MSTKAQKRNSSFNSKKNRELRLTIVANCYKHGMNYREIRKEVMAALDLQTLSLRTVHNDVMYLLQEWREYRIEDIDSERQLALERINEMIAEAWKAYEKSKEDYDKNKKTQYGKPDENGDMQTVGAQQTTEGVRSYGDPKWLELILKLIQERNKILGIYAPEEKKVSGAMTFGQLLMETGIVDNR